jgi:ribosome biogenesis GTPase / thiamine phosphate phosphatase
LFRFVSFCSVFFFRLFLFFLRFSMKPQQPKAPQPKRRIPDDHRAKSRRAAKTWAKESSVKEHFKKKRIDTAADSDDAVPLAPVSMTPRLRSIQAKLNFDPSELLAGQVVDSTGRSWIVQTEHVQTEHVQTEHVQTEQAERAERAERYECLVTRSIVTDNPASTLVAVGDYVLFKPDSISGERAGNPTGAIYAVKERHSKLARRAAGRDGIEQVIVSNVDNLVILMAAADPFYNRRLIDRYLIAAEQGGLAPLICINKIDLMDEAFVRDDLAVYAEQLGVPVMIVSAERQRGIGELRSALAGKVSVFSGPSGVGKSTLVNLLLGRTIQATSEVNQRTQRGQHTTTFSELFALPQPAGGFIADTPGIREFGMWQIERDELPFFFHEFDDVYHTLHAHPRARLRRESRRARRTHRRAALRELLPHP